MLKNHPTKAIQQLTEIQQLQEILQEKFSNAKTSLDEPLRKNGVWFLDVSLAGYHLNVSWQIKKGFGLVADESHKYGEGADEVYENLDGAVSRVIQLLNSKRPTVPPLTVRLKDIREELGLSQEEMGKRLGKNQGAVSRQESRTDCHVSTLTEYVNALGCELIVKVVLPDLTERELKLDEDLKLHKVRA